MVMKPQMNMPAFQRYWPFAEKCTPEIALAEFPIMRYVVNAAFANLDRWVRDGVPAPKAERIAVVSAKTSLGLR